MSRSKVMRLAARLRARGERLLERGQAVERRARELYAEAEEAYSQADDLERGLGILPPRGAVADLSTVATIFKKVYGKASPPSPDTGRSGPLEGYPEPGGEPGGSLRIAFRSLRSDG